MPDLIFPPAAQPPMDGGHLGPGTEPAVLDNRTELPDEVVANAVFDKWCEFAGLQYARPTNFQMYSNNQGSMLARTPFRTPNNVIQEIELSRAICDADDDVAATMGLCLALAYGEGVQNHHRDESTLEFFNQMTSPETEAGIDIESTLEELHREFLIAGSVTTLTLFTRNRLKYFPLKSDIPVEAQIQCPKVGVLHAEYLRVITNDVLGHGQLAYYVEQNEALKNWLGEYFNPTTSGIRKAIMAQEEPIAAQLFIGRYQVPWNDGDLASRGKMLYILNPSMVQRTTMPKGALPYPRPPLTRNFALLEAKRLLSLMDYALLMGGTNYIVVCKKGSDALPAQPPELDNLQNQVMHASRSGVMVGDHRLNIEIITPNLQELLNPAKRRMLGRKISMALLRVPEQVTEEAGNQGALNELEFTSRVIAADRRKMISHVQASFYQATANRNRALFKEGAPSIGAPKLILAGAKDYWSNVIQANDRGLIPHRWTVEALGFDYEAGLAEREREITRGDDEIMVPGSVPFSSPEAGPQDNGPGRPVGTSSNNGSGRDTEGQGRDPFAPNQVIKKTQGETIKAMVEGGQVSYIGANTQTLLEQFDSEELSFGYVVEAERESILSNQTIRAANSVIVPVNPTYRCAQYRTVKLTDGLRAVVGQRIGDEAMVIRALRFSEPQFDLKKASEYAIRWGFLTEPLIETASSAKRCPNCGEEMPDFSQQNPVCPGCNMDFSDRAPVETPPSMGENAEHLSKLSSDLAELQNQFKVNMERITEMYNVTKEEFAAFENVAFHRENEEYAKFHSAENRRKLAKEGKALPDGSYPIEDESDLASALTLINSGHGNVGSAKTLFRKRAKELGKANMIPDSWN